jgi:hypothetical protein
VTEKALAIAKEFGKKVYSFNLYAERRDGMFIPSCTHAHTHTRTHAHEIWASTVCIN